MTRQANKPSVLFLCTGNSCRSQMAEGFLRELARDEFEVASAGITPTRVNPMAVRVMADAAVDITSQRAKSVEEMADDRFDYVITVCDNAREACPVFPTAAKQLHWSFEDPAKATGTEKERLSVFRHVRNAISERVSHFIRTTRTESAKN